MDSVTVIIQMYTVTGHIARAYPCMVTFRWEPIKTELSGWSCQHFCNVWVKKSLMPLTGHCYTHYIIISDLMKRLWNSQQMQHITQHRCKKFFDGKREVASLSTLSPPHPPFSPNASIPGHCNLPYKIWSHTCITGFKNYLTSERLFLELASS